ncbi:hypothetical protein BAE30_04330 [Acidithiobacillus caldus]|uniref:Uncharacterized protein n=1 Tax=Acidithiobacillus caldus TaxID=33059 RepID=A0A1E7YZ62_9PROT|nr:hypothetical protein BAE30_04330 [Acidithiobacillus caldus]
MEVGITVYDRNGVEHQIIIEMPGGSYIPSVGDGLIFNGIVCTIEKRDFQVVGREKLYAWSLVAKENEEVHEG